MADTEVKCSKHIHRYASSICLVFGCLQQCYRSRGCVKYKSEGNSSNIAASQLTDLTIGILCISMASLLFIYIALPASNTAEGSDDVDGTADHALLPQPQASIATNTSAAADVLQF